MAVLGHRFVRGKLLQPDLVIMVKSSFVVIDENGSRDVHGVHQDQAFSDAAFFQGFLDVRSDIDQPPSRGDLEPEFFSVASHRGEASLLSALSSALPAYLRGSSV
jgi:hypothetical protein